MQLGRHAALVGGGGGDPKLGSPTVFRPDLGMAIIPYGPPDIKYATNSDRVKNRIELEKLIENITETKTTKEWLDVFEGSGMPYAAINDIKGTLDHEHGECAELVSSLLTHHSPSQRYGHYSAARILRRNEARLTACQVLSQQANDTNTTSDARPAHR